jgi:Na+/phosphate symporter
MALTIRTLSDTSEYTLAKIMHDNDQINTNTKAIEFVLEDYLVKCSSLEEEQKRANRYKKELWDAEEKLETIGKGFGMIQKMISKK